MTARAPALRPKFRVRLLALLIDYALILAWMAVLAAATMTVAAFTGGLANWLLLGTGGAQLLGIALLVLPVGLYLYLSESSPRQATVGKRALGLRVATAVGLHRPSRRQILVRTVVKLIPWEVAHFAVWNIAAMTAAGESEQPPRLLATMVLANLLPLSYVAMVLFQKDGRGPHDLLAGTRVVSG